MRFRLHFFLLAALALALPASAANIYVNNGLAPPNPANVFDDDSVAQGPLDLIVVRNAGCPASTASCPSPGAPTEVALVAGGSIEAILTKETSHADLLGGMVFGIFAASADDASLTLDGADVLGILEASVRSDALVLSGTVGGDARAWSEATLRIEGGSVGGRLRALDGGTLEIVGSGFAIDGVPVGFGAIAADSGLLTGTLASGDALSNDFERMAIGVGNIVLLPVPEPGSAVLLSLGLAVMALRRRMTLTAA